MTSVATCKDVCDWTSSARHLASCMCLRAINHAQADPSSLPAGNQRQAQQQQQQQPPDPPAGPSQPPQEDPQACQHPQAPQFNPAQARQASTGSGMSAPPRLDLRDISDRLEIISPEDVTLVKFLGAGGYGEVYLGKWHSSEAAIKCLNPSLFAGGEGGHVRTLLFMGVAVCVVAPGQGANVASNSFNVPHGCIRRSKPSHLTLPAQQPVVLHFPCTTALCPP